MVDDVSGRVWAAGVVCPWSRRVGAGAGADVSVSASSEVLYKFGCKASGKLAGEMIHCYASPVCLSADWPSGQEWAEGWRPIEWKIEFSCSVKYYYY